MTVTACQGNSPQGCDARQKRKGCAPPDSRIAVSRSARTLTVSLFGTISLSRHILPATFAVSCAFSTARVNFCFLFGYNYNQTLLRGPLAFLKYGRILTKSGIFETAGRDGTATGSAGQSALRSWKSWHQNSCTGCGASDSLTCSRARCTLIKSFKHNIDIKDRADWGR